MRPEIPNVCRTLAEDLVMRVLPTISPAYHQGTIGMIAGALSIVGEEWDRAASWRVAENKRLRELFREAAPVVSDSVLRQRLIVLAETPDDDLRISALTANNSALRATLIELHEHVESSQSPDARRVEAVIWLELAESTERRRLSTAQF